ncbi:hypothetical protein V9T40_011382 [Parthenolecanium corni]|uniref:Uncharacterized protein n=1 Tax=Parthenolecanium corni TaxID=536013 RepID=A0AAN9T705_9HEMI
MSEIQEELLPPIIHAPDNMEIVQERDQSTPSHSRAMSIADSIDGELHDLRNLQTPLSYSSDNISFNAHSSDQSFDTVDQVAYSPPPKATNGHPKKKSNGKKTKEPKETQRAPSPTPEELQKESEVKNFRYTITAAFETMRIVQDAIDNAATTPIDPDQLEPLKNVMELYLNTLRVRPAKLPEKEFDLSLPVAHKLQLIIFNANLKLKNLRTQPPRLADVAPTQPPPRFDSRDDQQKKLERTISRVKDADHRWQNIEIALKDHEEKANFYASRCEAIRADREYTPLPRYWGRSRGGNPRGVPQSEIKRLVAEKKFD